MGGLAVDPKTGLLWAFDDHLVIHVDPKTGKQLPASDKFLPRVYRSASFGQDGSIYLGEHLKGEAKREGVGTSIIFPLFRMLES